MQSAVAAGQRRPGVSRARAECIRADVVREDRRPNPGTGFGQSVSQDGVVV